MRNEPDRSHIKAGVFLVLGGIGLLGGSCYGAVDLFQAKEEKSQLEDQIVAWEITKLPSDRIGEVLEAQRRIREIDRRVDIQALSVAISFIAGAVMLAGAAADRTIPRK